MQVSTYYTLDYLHAFIVSYVPCYSNHSSFMFRQVGCDQGFHNYLYYEGGLRPYLQSHECSIRVHKQGDGTVNNLAALRNSPLREQGVLKTIEGHQTNPSVTDNIAVLNNDRSTLSPVVHQFDRDKELKVVIRKRTTVMLAKWKSNQATAR